MSIIEKMKELLGGRKKGPAQAAGEKIDQATERASRKLGEAAEKAGEKLTDAGQKLKDSEG